MNSTQTISHIIFSPEYDLTKDLVITIDFQSNLQTLDVVGRGDIPTGGLLIGLYDTSLTMSGSVSTRGLGYSNDFGNGSTTGITNAILGVGLDFTGDFYNNSTGSTLTANPVYQGNLIVVVGPYVSGFNYIGATNRYSVPVTNPIGQSISSTTNTELADDRFKRIRVRITDFGNTILVDGVFGETIPGKFINNFLNLAKVTQVCSFNKAGVFLSYASNDNNFQKLFINNININGIFTDSYRLSSTHAPLILNN